MDAMGWDGFLGAEYKPRNGSTKDGLAWINEYK
ncbi:MAG: hydroxypyruvate isomerase [Pseudomonadales bacterium]